MITKSDIKIKVEQCIDSEDWVWSLLDDHNGVRMDGYESSEQEAWAKARQARQEEIDYINSPPEHTLPANHERKLNDG